VKDEKKSSNIEIRNPKQIKFCIRDEDNTEC